MKKANKTIVTAIFLVLLFILNSCASIPEDVKAVENCDVDRYLGTWDEIARFDFRFEKNLDNVSAQYSLDNKGNVKVLNRGYNYEKGKWKKADGIAKFRGNKNVAELKVSFFGPFYAGYNV